MTAFPIAGIVMSQFPPTASNRSKVPAAGCHVASYGLSVQTIPIMLSPSWACEARTERNLTVSVRYLQGSSITVDKVCPHVK